MMNEPLHTIMSTDLITVAPDAPLSEVRKVFLNKRIHHLPIVQERKLLGLVTTWDMFKLGLNSDEYADMPVAEMMTTRLATLGPDEHIGAAAEVFMEHLFHAIPIIDDQRNLIGMITTYDLLRYEFSKEYSTERIQAEMLTGYH